MIFGHNLGNEDEHLIRSIRTHHTHHKDKKRDIAISLHVREDAVEDVEDIVQKKERIFSKLQKANKKLSIDQLFFFNAATHLLGDPALNVEEPIDLLDDESQPEPSQK